MRMWSVKDTVQLALEHCGSLINKQPGQGGTAGDAAVIISEVEPIVTQS